jgi:hypothetical protein
VIHRKLPCLVRLKKTVIQRRLALKKVHDIRSVPVCFPQNGLEALCPGSPVIGPDIPVPILIRPGFFTVPEPDVFLRGMTRNQIQKYPDSLLMSLGKKPDEIIIRPIPGGCLFIIPDIIACILKGGIKTRVYPEGITSKPPDIIQFLYDPRNIANPISIGIVKRLGIDFVENRVSQPLRHYSPLALK